MAFQMVPRPDELPRENQNENPNQRGDRQNNSSQPAPSLRTPSSTSSDSTTNRASNQNDGNTSTTNNNRSSTTSGEAQIPTSTSSSSILSSSSTSFVARPCVSPRDPTIRHAGRAHIRGKIRRVWRPRYLELCDTGLVRYYELPPTADIALPQDSDWDHVHMIPKDTLIIYHARIIDVTTLRDLHVGLPRGTFGFLFHGLRQIVRGSSKSNTSTNNNGTSNATSSDDGNNSRNPTRLDDIRNNNNNNQGNTQGCHPPHDPIVAPRDYLCAVSTLEEAQTWVVALQWAASTTKHKRHMMVRRSSSSNNIPGRLPPPGPMSTSSRSKPPSSSSASVSSSATTTGRQSSSRKMGRMVVTKVVSPYLIVRVPSKTTWLQWTVTAAYNIRLMLLQQQPQSTSMYQVEERHVQRTVSDVHDFLQQLQAEFPECPPVVASCREKLLSKSKTPDETIRTLHSIFHSLVLEGSIVNSQAVKDFFVLNSSNASPPKQSSTSLPPIHDPVALSSTFVKSISNIQPDSFVKEWLSSKNSSDPNPTILGRGMFWMWQQPSYVWNGIAGVSVAVAIPKFWSFSMVTIPVRVDALIASWVVAFSIGYSLSPNPTPAQDKPKKRKSRKPTTAVAPPPPTATTTATSTTNKEIMVDNVVTNSEEEDEEDGEEQPTAIEENECALSSPLPKYPSNNGESCWSIPNDNIFRVRGPTYLDDKIKLPSGPSPFTCRGVDVWLTDDPLRHIARHPDVLGGKLSEKDTFMVNFLLPFGNFVAYFEIPPISDFPPKLADVWAKFVNGNQQFRDARLKLLPVVVDGPWIVKAAVGNGTAPAVLGKVIPLQYFFRDGGDEASRSKKYYEVDVIITASSIAKGILSVVKGHTKSLTIAFAFIIEAAEVSELPETVLCALQVHALHLEDCPHLRDVDLDDANDSE